VSLTKILLATDGSPEAQRAERHALGLSRSPGSELHVVCVGQVPSPYAATESEILDYEFWKEMRQFAKGEASKSLEEVVCKIEDSGGRVGWHMPPRAVPTPRSCVLQRR
jgi:nucleotide-binding universal stress UspA family protein